MVLSRRMLFGAIALLTTGPASAAALPKPTGPVILVVTGKIDTGTCCGNTALFDLPMLESLGNSSFTTATPWFATKVTFEGVPMAKLMEVVGATGDKVTAIALNDYEVTIPREDFVRFGVLLAYKRDGHYMPVNDKGPLFIVYPYDSAPILRSQEYYSRSAWQVTRLVIE